MMSKDGLDGGLRGRVLEGIEPRKGTETIVTKNDFNIILLVRRNRTPKGDGNNPIHLLGNRFFLVRRNRTPKGDGNTIENYRCIFLI